MTAGQSLWVEASQMLDQLFTAHAASLGQLKNAPRNCVSHFAKKGKDGKPIPDYADLAMILDTVRPALAANGLSITQSFMPFGTDGTLMLVTTLGHKSGQFQRSFLPLRGSNEPQKLAAAATYLKRVALCALLGIAADDDDDGATAQRVAASVSADEQEVEDRAARALRDKKTPEERQRVLDHAAKLVDEGELPPAALARLKFSAMEMDSAQGVKDRPRKELAATS